MKTTLRLALAAAAFAAVPALAAEQGACAGDPGATGLHARVENMEEKMDRIRLERDPAEHERLMDLHAKLMREGVRELRKRNTGMACRMEMTDAMLDQMIRHQQAERAATGD
jgi:hypothetical protein